MTFRAKVRPSWQAIFSYIALALLIASCGTLQFDFLEGGTSVPTAQEATLDTSLVETKAGTQAQAEPAPTLTIDPAPTSVDEIIFSSHEEPGLFRWDKSGSFSKILERRVLYHRVSPDGLSVAFNVPLWEDPPNGLWVMGIDGSNPRHILETSSSSFQFTTTMSFIQDFIWQPDTNNIILSLCTNIFEGGEYYGDCQQVDLITVDALTGEAKLLTTTETANFSVSPNGEWLTVQRIDGIDLINTNKVSVQKNVLTYPRIADHGRSAVSVIPNVSWSRDNRMFYVAVSTPDPFIDYQTISPDASVSLYKVQVDGELEQLSTISGAFIFDNNIDLSNVRPTATAFSPDGRFVMMPGRTISDEAIALRLYSTEGEEIAVLHATMIEGWGWSPDSAQYAFGGIGDGGMLVDTDGNIQAFAPAVYTVSQFSWLGPETMTFTGYVLDVGYRIYFLHPGNEAEVLMEHEDDIQFDPWWEGGRSLR